MKPAQTPFGLHFGLRFWLLTLAALAFMALTASLGFWQLARATQKQAMQATLDAHQGMAALAEGDLLRVRPTEVPALLHRSVALRGQWLAEATVFLDNRQMRGQPGFWLLTPLRLQGGQGTVLVQRGWAPRNFLERTRLPDIDTPAGEVRLQGRIAGHVPRLYEFAPSGQGEGASRIRQNLDLAAYGAELGLPLLPLIVVQTDADGDGLRRDWAPVDAGVEKHYGYAFQWFGLCGLLVVLYVWFQFVRPISRRGARPRA